MVKLQIIGVDTRSLNLTTAFLTRGRLNTVKGPRAKNIIFYPLQLYWGDTSLGLEQSHGLSP
ncbi:hypothetical protein YC2023_118322 [Brassica napus]